MSLHGLQGIYILSVSILDSCIFYSKLMRCKSKVCQRIFFLFHPFELENNFQIKNSDFKKQLSSDWEIKLPLFLIIQKSLFFLIFFKSGL